MSVLAIRPRPILIRLIDDSRYGPQRSVVINRYVHFVIRIYHFALSVQTLFC